MSQVPPEYYLVRQTNPARTEVHATNGDALLAVLTDGSRTVALKGTSRTFTENDMPVSDSFNRICSGWNILSENGSWSLSGSADATTCSVANGEGLMNVTTNASSYRGTVITHAIQDADVSVSCQISKDSIGSNLTMATIMGYQDTNNHYFARANIIPSNSTLGDDFSRVASGGWGTSLSGLSWTVSGTAADCSVDGAVAKHNMSAVNASLRCLLGSGTDFDISVKISTDALAAGASIVGSIVGRYQDANNHYLFRIRFSPTQVIYASLQKQVAGTITMLGTETAVSGLTHSVGTWYRLRARAVGSVLDVKIWQDGADEPTTWNVTVNDTTFATSGSAGVRSLLSTGITTPIPVGIMYDDYNCIFDNGSTDCSVTMGIYKQVAGVVSTVAAAVASSETYSAAAGDVLVLRSTMSNGVLQAKIWKSGDTEPSSWLVTGSDTTFTTGRVGVRAYANAGVSNLPVTYTWSNFVAYGTWTTPPVVTHDMWVRLLPSPFAGRINFAWLTAALADSSPDILAYAMQYINGALPQTDTGGMQYAGDAGYGPLQADGTRQEGSDFNDYLGITWGTDVPEASQFRCLDCSGAVRMIYGYRGGYDLGMIPRVSYDIAANGPGTIIVQNTGVAPGAEDLAKIQVGDVLCFDADTGDGTQIDHVGMYLGIDSATGVMRFYSSRKTVNGPTIADVGGPSVIGTITGNYAQTLRLVRRF